MCSLSWRKIQFHCDVTVKRPPPSARRVCVWLGVVKLVRVLDASFRIASIVSLNGRRNRMFILAKYLRQLPFVDYSNRRLFETMCTNTLAICRRRRPHKERNACTHISRNRMTACDNVRQSSRTPRTDSLHQLARYYETTEYKHVFYIE